MAHKILKIITIFLFLLFPFYPVLSAEPLSVVINEIAWMGTEANSSDEWIELYNNTDEDINLESWGLYEAGGTTLIEPLTGIIKAKSYYLIERTDDTTIVDIPASQEPSSWSGYGLNNSGENLQLIDNNSKVIDEVDCSNGWFAGEGKPDYKTMEKKGSQGSGSDPNNWVTNNGVIINGHDAGGNPINGTPGEENSVNISTSQPEPQSEVKTEPEAQNSEEQQKEQKEKPAPISYPSGVLINELVPSPEGKDELEEWLELKNINNEEIDISGWKIQDTVGSIKTYIFPEGTKIKANDYLVLTRPVSKITLNNSGDTLKLIQPNGNVLDTVTYEKASQGQSYNRTESGWSWSTTLTSGSSNIVSVPHQPAEEEISEKNPKDGSLKDNLSGDLKTKKGLASIGEQIPKFSKPLYVFLIALGIAIISGIIVLILKKKLKTESLL